MVVEGEHPGEHVVGRVGRRGAGGGVDHEPDELDGAADEEAVARPAHAVAREVALQPPRPPPERLHEPRHRQLKAQPRGGGERRPLPRPRPRPRPPHDGPAARAWVGALRRRRRRRSSRRERSRHLPPGPASSWWQEAPQWHMSPPSPGSYI